MQREHILKNCRILLEAYKTGRLGDTTMPEDSNPGFKEKEERLVYFTLPMSLNYQRDSFKLWESVLQTWNDQETQDIFSIQNSAKMEKEELRKKLLKHKIALQPNKHLETWRKLAETFNEWGSMSNFLQAQENDFLKIRKIMQETNKKEFPYLSGPKIFNYWSFILQEYGKVKLKNAEYIDIAPDTHVTKASEILGVINKQEAETLSKEKISQRWRELLKGTEINPIDMHPPLWFWSKSNFSFSLK